MDFSFIDIPLYLLFFFIFELLLKRERFLLSFFVYLFNIVFARWLEFSLEISRHFGISRLLWNFDPEEDIQQFVLVSFFLFLLIIFIIRIKRIAACFSLNISLTFMSAEWLEFPFREFVIFNILEV